MASQFSTERRMKKTYLCCCNKLWNLFYVTCEKLECILNMNGRCKMFREGLLAQNVDTTPLLKTWGSIQSLLFFVFIALESTWWTKFVILCLLVGLFDNSEYLYKLPFLALCIIKFSHNRKFPPLLSLHYISYCSCISIQYYFAFCFNYFVFCHNLGYFYHLQYIHNDHKLNSFNDFTNTYMAQWYNVPTTQ